MNHFRQNKHDLTYTLSQPEMRDYLSPITEEMLKYVYDGYTYDMGMKPIRKHKIRKKIQLEFHTANHSKHDAQELIAKAIAYTFALN